MNETKKSNPKSKSSRELNKGEDALIRVQANTDVRGEGDSPVLRFSELLAMTKVGKSKAYDLMNPDSESHDPDYPTGFPLFDSPRSPKVYWRHEAIAWIEGRYNKFKQKPQGMKK